MTSESTFSEAAAADGNHKKQQESRHPIDSVSSFSPTEPKGNQLLLHGQEPETGMVKVVFSQLALRQIEGHGTTDLRRELGGVLLGHATQSGAANMVKVAAAIPVQTDDHGPVHFTFTADTWAQLHKDREERYPKLDVVGWYHTHPDLGAFYSADDLVVHSAAFVLPWQVGLVLDPLRGEHCLVGWHLKEGSNVDRDLAGLPGYYELLDHQNSSAISWRFSEAAIWRQGGYLPNSMTDSGEVYTPPSDWPALPFISPWWGVFLGGLSLLISLLLLLERLLGGA